LELRSHHKGISIFFFLNGWIPLLTTSQNHIYLDPSKLAAAVKPAKVLIGDEEAVEDEVELDAECICCPQKEDC